MKFSTVASAFALALLLSSATGQFICSNRKTGGTIFSDVYVERGTCILQDVAITGSILLTGGNLVTNGQVNVSGSITAHGAGTIELFGQPRVLGVVSVSNFRGSTLIGQGAQLGSVLIADTDVFEARGSMGTLNIRSTKVTNLNGARLLFGGLSVEQGLGDVSLCGTQIRGGIQMLESKGSLIVSSRPGCAMNTVSGSIFVLKGEGDVILENSQVTAADLSVSEQIGNVNVRNTALSDVAVGGVTGNVTFENVRTDSDASISGNKGSVVMIQGNIQGDMRISGNEGSVDVRNTNFNNEVVSVSGNTGPVSIFRNTRLSVGINENLGGVWFSENQGTVATLNNNRGGLYIRGNTLTGLSCVDNIGPITSGVPGKRTNSVSGVRSGQCAKL